MHGSSSSWRSRLPWAARTTATPRRRASRPHDRCASRPPKCATSAAPWTSSARSSAPRGRGRQRRGRRAASSTLPPRPRRSRRERRRARRARHRKRRSTASKRSVPRSPRRRAQLRRAGDAGDLPPLERGARGRQRRRRSSPTPGSSLDRAKRTSRRSGTDRRRPISTTAQTAQSTRPRAAHQQALASAPAELRADIEAKASALRLAERGLRDTVDPRAVRRAIVAERLVSPGQVRAAAGAGIMSASSSCTRSR